MEECLVSVDEIEQSQTISRTEQPDNSLKFWKIENLTVKDEDGYEYRFGDLYKKQKTIIVFLRHFLCHMCKEYVDDAAIIPERCLQDENVKFILIGCGDPKFIKPFREITKYSGPLYTDENRAIYNGAGLYEKSMVEKANIKKPSPHVKSNFLSGVMKSTWRGMKFRESQGDMNQQGGALILGPGNIIHHQHFDLTPADHAPINDLLILAEVQAVNFPRDKRVITM